MKKILVAIIMFTTLIFTSCVNNPTWEETFYNDDFGNNPTWEETFYNDDFGNPTENTYMSTQVDGVFSNSVTINSKLTVTIMVDGDYLNIKLYEYGRGPAKSFASGTGGVMKIKLENEVITVNTIYDADDVGVKSTDLMIWKEGVAITKNIGDYLSKLQGEENVKCLISINETHGGKSSYSFNIPTNGLDVVLNNIK